MRKFEYTTQSIDRGIPGQLYEQIDRWADDGWKLVSVVHIAGLNYELYWERGIRRSWFQKLMGK